MCLHLVQHDTMSFSISNYHRFEHLVFRHTIWHALISPCRWGFEHLTCPMLLISSFWTNNYASADIDLSDVLSDPIRRHPLAMLALTGKKSECSDFRHTRFDLYSSLKSSRVLFWIASQMLSAKLMHFSFFLLMLMLIVMPWDLIYWFKSIIFIRQKSSLTLGTLILIGGGRFRLTRLLEVPVSEESHVCSARSSLLVPKLCIRYTMRIYPLRQILKCQSSEIYLSLRSFDVVWLRDIQKSARVSISLASHTCSARDRISSYDPSIVCGMDIL